MDVSNLQFQIFINIKADLNFIQYSSSILWQMNKICGASQNEKKFIIEANATTKMKQLQEDTLMANSAQIIVVSFDYEPTFQFIVGFKQNTNLQTTNNF